MKKILSVVLALLMVLSFAACKATPADNSDTSAQPETLPTGATVAEKDNKVEVNTEGDGLPEVLNTMEYTLYQNIFYNGQGKDYEGKSVTKEGIFASIQDKFNNVTRYYVWGYNDKTKCCDWQWELDYNDVDAKNVPSNGSLVEVVGEFDSDDDALDGYWIEGAKIKVKQEYKSVYDCDIDMTTLSATLERVQLLNMQNFKEDFEGKSVAIYGRVLGESTLQHPYYDEMWNQDFSAKGTTPATGIMCIVTGKYEGGVIKGGNIGETKAYG